MDNNSRVIINGTPHPLALALSCVGHLAMDQRGERHHVRKGGTLEPMGGGAKGVELVGGVECLIVPPSGIRFECEPRVVGDPLAASVSFELSPAVLARDAEALVDIVHGYFQGTSVVLVVSEISARTLAFARWRRATTEHVQARYPVIAGEALRLPPDQRWASHLAVAPGTELL